jgi:hypothetical protein
MIAKIASIDTVGREAGRCALNQPTRTAPTAQEEIRDLAAAYALACDLRDAARLTALFDPGAQLVVHMPGAEARVRQAPDGIGSIPALLARYDQTFHFVGLHRIVVDGDAATGDVYCDAHHRSGHRDLVMHIHYEDRYRRGADGWRFARRDVRVLWTDTREIG